MMRFSRLQLLVLWTSLVTVFAPEGTLANTEKVIFTVHHGPTQEPNGSEREYQGSLDLTEW